MGLAAGMDLSVVIPLYRCEGTIRPLCDRLECALRGLPDIDSFEIILVEDHGPDQSWRLIREICAEKPFVRGMLLSRNFGQHHAITAGLTACTGDWAVVMDGDLQDRPEDIRLLWGAVAPDTDMVCARRPRRKHAWWRRMGSALTFQIFSFLSGMTIDPAVTNFRLMSRTAIDAFLSMGETNRILGAHLEWLGFKAAFVEMQHYERAEGRSGYSVMRLARMAVDLILSHSNRPLMLSVAVGSTICFITCCVIAYVLFEWFANGRVINGWTSLMLSVWFLGGAVIANLGLLGIYIGKIFDETKRRPNFIVARTINFGDAHSSDNLVQVPDAHRKAL